MSDRELDQPRRACSTWRQAGVRSAGIKYQRKLNRPVSGLIRDRRSRGRGARDLHQGLSSAGFVSGWCFLYLAVPHRHQHGEELPGLPGRRAPTLDEVSILKRRRPSRRRSVARHQHARAAADDPPDRRNRGGRAMAALPEELRTAIMLRELKGSVTRDRRHHGMPDWHGALAIFRAREAIAERLRPLLDARPRTNVGRCKHEGQSVGAVRRRSRRPGHACGVRRHAGCFAAQGWDTYCLIGDTLRGDSAGSSDFVSRVAGQPGGRGRRCSRLGSRRLELAQRGLVHRLMPLAAR